MNNYQILNNIQMIIQKKKRTKIHIIKMRSCISFQPLKEIQSYFPFEVLSIQFLIISSQCPSFYSTSSIFKLSLSCKVTNSFYYLIIISNLSTFQTTTQQHHFPIQIILVFSFRSQLKIDKLFRRLPKSFYVRRELSLKGVLSLGNLLLLVQQFNQMLDCIILIELGKFLFVQPVFPQAFYLNLQSIDQHLISKKADGIHTECAAYYCDQSNHVEEESNQQFLNMRDRTLIFGSSRKIAFVLVFLLMISFH